MYIAGIRRRRLCDFEEGIEIVRIYTRKNAERENSKRREEQRARFAKGKKGFEKREKKGEIRWKGRGKNRL